ncbi:bifunctional DNA primase/polymerase, partial [Lacticaseibacillus paracasei]
VSGLLALDIDGIEGERLLQELSGGDLPDTPEFTTGKGRRLLYAWPEWAIKAGHQLTTGVLQILGKGQQTVMPPSRHCNGTVYVWTAEHGP